MVPTSRWGLYRYVSFLPTILSSEQITFQFVIFFISSACLCNLLGTASCDKISGVCTCSNNYNGAQCDECVDGRYDAESGCLDCGCDPDNSQGDVCDKETGQCDCIDNM